MPGRGQSGLQGWQTHVTNLAIAGFRHQGKIVAIRQGPNCTTPRLRNLKWSQNDWFQLQLTIQAKLRRLTTTQGAKQPTIEAQACREWSFNQSKSTQGESINLEIQIKIGLLPRLPGRSWRPMHNTMTAQCTRVHCQLPLAFFTNKFQPATWIQKHVLTDTQAIRETGV